MSAAVEPVTTVVVVTFNSARHLPGLLASLDAGLADIGPWSLVVVDNDSSDSGLELLGRLRPEAQIVRMGRNAGYAAAINAGLAGAPPGPALVLNPDVRLRPGCAARLLAAFDDPRVGLAAPRILAPDGRTSWSIRRDPSVLRVWAESLLGGHRAARLGLSEMVAEPARYLASHDVEWATGAVVAVSAACRSRVGEWDESFFLYSEEVDYFQRARRAGFTARFVAEAEAEHESGAYGTDVELWRILVRNRIRLFARHHGPVATTAFRAGLAVGELLRAPRSAAHRAGLRSAVTTELRSATDGPTGVPVPDALTPWRARTPRAARRGPGTTG